MSPEAKKGPVARGVEAFGRFWWEFLVGDTPELFLAALALIAITFALRHDEVAAVVVLPVLAVAVLLASAWRGRRRNVRREGPGA